MTGSALSTLAAGALGTTGITKWILDNAVPLLLLLVAVLMLWLGGGRGDNAGVMRRVGPVLLALGLIGLAVSGLGVNIGTWLVNLFVG